MQHKVVIDAFFGDSGKGNTVQWLCQNSNRPIVHRFSGGPQAGHRVVHNGKSHICSSWGSGVLLGIPTYLNKNVFVDPICIYNEYVTLTKEGVEVPPLYINENCRVITPYDVLANSLNDKIHKDGTCGKGIYNTYKRDLDTPKYEWSALNNALEDPLTYLEDVKEYYEFGKDEALEELFIRACNFLRNNTDVIKIVSWSPTNDQKLSYDFDTVIWEGSQGLLLDMDCGFMPHCTPSKTGLNGIPESNFKNPMEVYLVMRPYLTRHGNGWEFTDKRNLSNYFTLDEPSNGDDGVQGLFKRGAFDFPLFCRVLDRHRLDNYDEKYDLKFNIVVTHWDCIKGENIPINGGLIMGHPMSKKAFVKSLMLCGLPIDHVYLGMSEDSNIIEAGTIYD